MDTIWYASYIAIFDTIRYIVPSLFKIFWKVNFILLCYWLQVHALWQNQMSLAGGGCPLSYPNRGSISLNAMSVSTVSSAATNSPCQQFRVVTGSSCSKYSRESKCVGVKESGSLSFVSKPYSNGTLVPADSTLQNPAVVLYPREKVCVHWHEAIPKCEPVGLWNAGNSCFLNSVLQCLTFTPPLANYFMFEGHKSKCISFCDVFSLTVSVLVRPSIKC